MLKSSNAKKCEFAEFIIEYAVKSKSIGILAHGGPERRYTTVPGERLDRTHSSTDYTKSLVTRRMGTGRA